MNINSNHEIVSDFHHDVDLHKAGFGNDNFSVVDRENEIQFNNFIQHKYTIKLISHLNMRYSVDYGLVFLFFPITFSSKRFINSRASIH